MRKAIMKIILKIGMKKTTPRGEREKIKHRNTPYADEWRGKRTANTWS